MMKVEAEEQSSHRKGRQDAIVKREDAQDSARVELAEEDWVGERIEEDSGYEKARQNEEQIDTTGTVGECIMDSYLESGVSVEGE